MPGAVASAGAMVDEAFEVLVLRTAEEAIKKLNTMREEEGKHLDAELRTRMANLSKAVDELSAIVWLSHEPCWKRLKVRMAELIGGKVDPDRILQEAAMLAERSDVEEELVRLKTHIQHFTGLLDQGHRSRQKTRFPAPGVEPRSQHASLKNLWSCGRRATDHRTRARNEI